MTRKPLDSHSLFSFCRSRRADDPAIVLLRGGAQLVDQANQGFVDRRDADKAEDVALQILDAVGEISATPSAASNSLG